MYHGGLGREKGASLSIYASAYRVAAHTFENSDGLLNSTAAPWTLGYVHPPWGISVQGTHVVSCRDGFFGFIDNFAVFDSALSGAECAAVGGGDVTTRLSSLALRYTFNDGDAHDSSGHFRHGTVSGALFESALPWGKPFGDSVTSASAGWQFLKVPAGIVSGPPRTLSTGLVAFNNGSATRPFLGSSARDSALEAVLGSAVTADVIQLRIAVETGASYSLQLLFQELEAGWFPQGCIYIACADAKRPGAQGLEQRQVSLWINGWRVRRCMDMYTVAGPGVMLLRVPFHAVPSLDGVLLLELRADCGTPYSQPLLNALALHKIDTSSGWLESVVLQVPHLSQLRR